MVGVLIRYNRRTGDRIVRVFDGPTGYQDAVNDPGFRRDRGRTGTDWEVAVIGSDSLESVKHTHSRYFSGRDLTAQYAV